VNKVTERFIHAHRQELSTIADKNADEGEPWNVMEQDS
jgi:hypothetical protein